MLTKIIDQYRKELSDLGCCGGDFCGRAEYLAGDSDYNHDHALLSHQTNLLLALSEARVEKWKEELEILSKVQEKAGEVVVEGHKNVYVMVKDVATRRGKIETLQTLIKEEEEFIKFLKGEEKELLK